MAAQRSGPFSRRCGDRNRSWTQNNEGKFRRRDRMTIDSKDSQVFFRKRIPSGKQSGKQRGSDATTVRRKWNQGGEEAMAPQANRRDKKRHRISITESDVSSLKQDGGKENVTESTDRISFLSGCEQILLPSNRASSSLRGVAESLIFHPFPKKATTPPPVIQGFAGGRICADVASCQCDRTAETTIDSFAGRDRIYSGIRI